MKGKHMVLRVDFDGVMMFVKDFGEVAEYTECQCGRMVRLHLWEIPTGFFSKDYFLACPNCSQYGMIAKRAAEQLHRGGQLGWAKPFTIGEAKEPQHIDPNDPEAHLRLGVAYGQQGRLDEAITEFNEVLRLNPNHGEAHRNLGVAYDNQGKRDDAIREFKKALELDPNNVSARLNLGITYCEQGNLDEGITELKEVLKIAPNFFKAYNALGRAYYEQGKFGEAIECYQTFCKLAPPEYTHHVRKAEKSISRLKKMI